MDEDIKTRALFTRNNAKILLVLLCLFAFLVLPSVHLWSSGSVRGMSVWEYTDSFVSVFGTFLFRYPWFGKYLPLIGGILEAVIAAVTVISCYRYVSDFTPPQFAIAFTTGFTVIYSILTMNMGAPLFIPQAMLLPVLFYITHSLVTAEFLNPKNRATLVTAISIGFSLWQAPVLAFVFIPVMFFMIGSHIGNLGKTGLVRKFFTCFMGILIGMLPETIRLFQQCVLGKYPTLEPVRKFFGKTVFTNGWGFHGFSVPLTIIIVLAVALFVLGILKFEEKTMLPYHAATLVILIIAMVSTGHVTLTTLLFLCPVTIFLSETITEYHPKAGFIPFAVSLITSILCAIIL